MRDHRLGSNSGVRAVIMVISRARHVSRSDILSLLSSHGCDCVFLGLHLDAFHMYVTLLPGCCLLDPWAMRTGSESW